MHKIVIVLILFIFYLFIVYKYYSSVLLILNFNRLNVENFKRRFLLPVNNDTENVIEFNDSFENKLIIEKNNFWELLLNK